LHTHTVSIPSDCNEAQFLIILDDLGLTHSEPDYIEKDLTTIRGKTVKINAGNDKVVMSYSVPMPDPI